MARKGTRRAKGSHGGFLGKLLNCVGGVCRRRRGSNTHKNKNNENNVPVEPNLNRRSIENVKREFYALPKSQQEAAYEFLKEKYGTTLGYRTKNEERGSSFPNSTVPNVARIATRKRRNSHSGMSFEEANERSATQRRIAENRAKNARAAHYAEMQRKHNSENAARWSARSMPTLGRLPPKLPSMNDTETWRQIVQSGVVDEFMRHARRH